MVFNKKIFFFLQQKSPANEAVQCFCSCSAQDVFFTTIFIVGYTVDGCRYTSNRVSEGFWTFFWIVDERVVRVLSRLGVCFTGVSIGVTLLMAVDPPPTELVWGFVELVFELFLTRTVRVLLQWVRLLLLMLPIGLAFIIFERLVGDWHCCSHSFSY